MKSNLYFPFLENSCNVATVDKSSNISLRIVSASDYNNVINVINTVARERKYLQTDRYIPTPNWEYLLAEGINVKNGLLLMAVENQQGIIGFIRLYPDDEHPLGRRAGNIGLALLHSFRSRGIGAIILKVLISRSSELGYDILTANILESNLRSRKLFSKYGFTQMRCRNIFLDFLNDHVNELYYELELSTPLGGKTL